MKYYRKSALNAQHKNGWGSSGCPIFKAVMVRNGLALRGAARSGKVRRSRLGKMWRVGSWFVWAVTVRCGTAR